MVKIGRSKVYGLFRVNTIGKECSRFSAILGSYNMFIAKCFSNDCYMHESCNHCLVFKVNGLHYSTVSKINRKTFVHWQHIHTPILNIDRNTKI